MTNNEMQLSLLWWESLSESEKSEIGDNYLDIDYRYIGRNNIRSLWQKLVVRDAGFCVVDAMINTRHGNVVCIGSYDLCQEYIDQCDDSINLHVEFNK